MWPLLIAIDLLTRAVQAHREAYLEAATRVRQADRYLSYVSTYGTPEQIQDAQEVADAWRDYRDSL
ncbi:MAG: hypothetical protein ACRDZ4_13835 [Egibacteraceae bacterium]